MNILGKNIRLHRAEQGISQEKLAKELNVVRQTVSKWEKGYSQPDAEQMSLLADIFHTDIETLMSKAVNNSSPSDDERRILGNIENQLTKLHLNGRKILISIGVLSLLLVITLVVLIFK